jgi:hypothetical protein
MEHVVTSVYLYTPLQAVLCYSYTYAMIFITIFKISHKLYIALGSPPSSPAPIKTLGAHLL